MQPVRNCLLRMGVWVLLCRLFSPGWVAGQASLVASHGIPYQTTLRSVTAGVATPYQGEAYFKFVLYRQTTPGGSRTPVWSHDPSYLASLAPGRSEEVPPPGKMVRLTVVDGVASLLLGTPGAVLLEADGTASTQPDGAGGTLPLPMSVLDVGALGGGTISLRVWVGKSTSTFDLLSPDLPMAASPFALRAGVAESVTAGSVSETSLAPSVTEPLQRMAALADSANDATLVAAGFQSVRSLPAAPYVQQGQSSPPTGRANHVSAWTGTELLVFGGVPRINGTPLNGGVWYRPAADAWGALQPSGAPAARSDAASVWTGSEWLIWGGVGVSGLLNDGGGYLPAETRWETLPAVPGAFAARRWHTAVWTGSHMLLWGGLSLAGTQADGLAYQPSTRTWQALPPFPGEPRYLHSAVWTGTEMIVWGGQTLENGAVADGYRFVPGATPATGTWHLLPAAPLSARFSHAAFWTPHGMVIWGGVQGASALADGALWRSADSTWVALPSAAGFLSAASQVQGAWSRAGLFLHGGSTGPGASSAAAYLELPALRWHAAPPPGPGARFGHTVAAIDGGAALLIFGGATPTSAGALNDLWRLPAEWTQYLYRKP